MLDTQNWLQVFRREKLQKQIYEMEKCQSIFDLQIKNIDNKSVDKAFDVLNLADISNQERFMEFYHLLKDLETQSSQHFFAIKDFIETLAEFRDFVKNNTSELGNILKSLQENNIITMKLTLNENEKLIKELDQASSAFGVKDKTPLGFADDFKKLEESFKTNYHLNRVLFNTVITFKHFAIIAKTLKLIFNLKINTLDKNKYVVECQELIEKIYNNYISSYENYALRIKSRIIEDIDDAIYDQFVLGKSLCVIVIPE